MPSPKWLSVKNYARYQHYKNRNPPWIKLYWDLLSDEAFVRLRMAERGFYCHCLLLASRHANAIPNDLEYICLQLKIADRSEGQAMITTLINKRFLLAWCKQRASKPLAVDDAPSTEIRDQRSESFFPSSSEDQTDTDEDGKKEERKELPRARKAARAVPVTGAETWDRYAESYRSRYGVDPVRNARVNSQLAQLVTRLGQEEAPQVAGWYLSHNRPLYVQARHPVALLLRDAEGLHTEWRTGVKATTLEARSAEQRDNVVEQLKRVRAMGRQEDHHDPR